LELLQHKLLEFAVIHGLIPLFDQDRSVLFHS
jgi:hypothetical protein